MSLDFADDHAAPDGQHYAFLVSEEDFDAIRQRIVDRGRPYWAFTLARSDSQAAFELSARGPGLL